MGCFVCGSCGDCSSWIAAGRTGGRTGVHQKCPERSHRGDLTRISSLTAWISLAGMEVQPRGWKSEIMGSPVSDSKIQPGGTTKIPNWDGTMLCAGITHREKIPFINQPHPVPSTVHTDTTA